MRTDGEDAVRAEIERIEAMINSPGMRRMRQEARASGKYIRPRDAASIILIEGRPGHERIVMGKRNKALKFMPGALVFPGGRVDTADRRIESADELHPETEAKLIANMRNRPTQADTHAMGIAAVRELAEETGILVGTACPTLPSHRDWQAFREHGIAPRLGPLRLIARAVTPPGVHRRFDTWFFAARADAIAHVPEGGFDPSGELEELQWIRPEDAIRSDTREITRVMLVELINRLKLDPELDPSTPAPAYVTRNGHFRRSLM